MAIFLLVGIIGWVLGMPEPARLVGAIVLDPAVVRLLVTGRG
ncbi:MULTISPECIES: hypothetical protein [unclassified Rathayibacter]|nr:MULTISPECIES: hypothetical protein [unclassified Rathayibacter]